MIENHSVMTDPELYSLCKKWGSEVLEARRKFIGLLPEVYKRRLFERRGFTSIYHFAAELGGVGEQLVNEVLRLEKRFEGMPNLHLALVKGEIGMSKLARIASVVEVGNEAVMCEKIRSLSRRAVDILVKEMRGGSETAVGGDGLFEIGIEVNQELNENRSGLLKTENGAESLAGQTCFATISSMEQAHKISTFKNDAHSLNHDFEIMSVLSPEVKAKLKELIDKKLDVNAVLMEAFAKREDDITHEKAEIGETPAKSRYIPVRIKRLLEVEFGRKCAVENCHKLADQIHHENYYSLYRDHDPRALKPLCRGHHELEHVR